MKSFIIFKKTISEYLTAVLIAGLIILLLINTHTYKQSMIDGIYTCGKVLVPSLFPFLFLSSFIVYSNGLSPITKLLGFLSKIFKIPKEGIIAVLLCLIGGFPVGAKTVSTLYNTGKISLEDAKKLSYCCVGAGPGFLVTFIGEGIFLSKKFGLILLASNSLSVIALLILSRAAEYLKLKIKSKSAKTNHQNNISEKEKIKVKSQIGNINENNRNTSSKMPIGEAIVKSTESAVQSTFSMCGFVLIFIVINNILSLTPVYSEYIAFIMEITSGIINYGNNMSYELIAFFVGFGGICVHFQIYGIIKEIKINKAHFVMMRILQGGVSAISVYFLLKLFPVVKETFSNISGSPHPAFSSTIWGAFAIIILSAIFLISINTNIQLKEDNYY